MDPINVNALAERVNEQQPERSTSLGYVDLSGAADLASGVGNVAVSASDGLSVAGDLATVVVEGAGTLAECGGVLVEIACGIVAGIFSA